MNIINICWIGIILTIAGAYIFEGDKIRTIFGISFMIILFVMCVISIKVKLKKFWN